jgi:hypothetical protein
MKSIVSKMLVAVVTIVSLSANLQASAAVRPGLTDTTKKSKMKADKMKTDKMKPAKMDKMKTAKDTGKMSKMGKM